MARERVDQEAVPTVEVWRDALQRADKALKQWPRGARVAASIGLIAAVTTASQAKEGIIVSPAISPSEGKETALDVSQAQAEAPEIAVPLEAEEAPEYIERRTVKAEEVAPQQEVLSKPEVLASLRINYTIRPYDTLSEIAQRFGTTQDEILALNPEIKDPNLIHPGEDLVIPEVSVEKTAEFLQDLQKNVNEIYEVKQSNSKGRTGTLSGVRFPDIDDIRRDIALGYPVLGEIFDRAGSDLVSLQEFIESGEQNSPEARKTAKEIMEYWNIAPGEKEEVEEPEIIVNPEVENDEWIVEKIKELLSFLPNSGRVVKKIFIIEPGGTRPAWTDTFRDHGAYIHLEERESWIYKEDRFLGVFLHEFSHGASLYSEGYNLRFLTPAEVINLVLKNAQTWNQEYQTYQGPPPLINETEWDAWFASDFMTNFLRRGEPIAFRTPEIYQARLRFVNLWLSKQLGENIDIIRVGEQLGFR